MGLPKITFDLRNGGLGQQATLKDKVVGLLITGVTNGGVSLNTPYRFFSMKEVVTKGITLGGANGFAHKHLQRFYDQAGEGAEIWVMLISEATTAVSAMDKNGSYAPVLLDAAGGAIRVLGLCRSMQTAPTDNDDGDGYQARINAQTLAEAYAAKMQPLRVVIGINGYKSTSAVFDDLETYSYNRVALLISTIDNTNAGKYTADVALLLGRLASIPVQRNIGRVADGPISQTAFSSGYDAMLSMQAQWENLYAANIIFLRNYVGKPGFYFSDDLTLANDEDDYKGLSRGLVIDKAQLLAYRVLVENLLDEVEMTAEGKVHPAVVKSWQGKVENALATMVAAGNLSAQACYIDEQQNVLSTGIMQVVLKLVPVGYAKTIEVSLGFTTAINNS